MDIRLFHCRCFVLLGLGLGYEAQNSYQTTHQWADDVEGRYTSVGMPRTVLCVIPQAVHGTSTLVTVALSSVLRLKSSGR